jgi:hypothetical protein
MSSVNWRGPLSWWTDVGSFHHADEWLLDSDGNLEGVCREINAHGTIEGSQTAVAPSFKNGFYLATGQDTEGSQW